MPSQPDQPLQQPPFEQHSLDQTAKSIWHYKPWWCQPWSIALTGISLIGGSWVVFHLFWLTLLVAIPVGAWMGFFLLLYPRLMLQSELFTAPTSSVSQDCPTETGK